MATPLDYGAAGSPRNAPSLAAWAKATGDAVGNPDLAWKSLSLLNGWVNYGTAYTPPRYRLLPGGIVSLQMMIKDGTSANAQAATLPAGYRPGYQLLLIGYGSAGAFRWDVYPNGNVIPGAGAATQWISMQTMFLAEA